MEHQDDISIAVQTRCKERNQNCSIQMLENLRNVMEEPQYWLNIRGYNTD